MNIALEVLNAELKLARKQVSDAFEHIKDNETAIHETKLHMSIWQDKVKELEQAILTLSKG